MATRDASAVDRGEPQAPVDVLGPGAAVAALVLLALVSPALIYGPNNGTADLLHRYRGGAGFLWQWFLPGVAAVVLVYLLCDGGTSWRRPEPASIRPTLVASAMWLGIVVVASFGLRMDSVSYAGPRAAVSLVVTIPVLEELIFRGAVFRLAERVRPIGSGRVVWSFPVVLSSVLFALGHLQYWYFDVPATLRARWYTPVFGLLCGVIRARSRSVRPAMALHVATNAIALLAVVVL